MPHSVPSQLTQLQEQYDALQLKNRRLQAALDEQQTLAAQWLTKRTEELQAEAQEQKKAETLQRVFYRIAERATAGLSLYDFLRTVHQLLGELLYAKNFYVALVNADQQTLDYPYYEDENDQGTFQYLGRPRKRGLTEFVLRTGQAQIISAARFLALQRNGEITEAGGDLRFQSWLGVPMQMQGRVNGVLAVQGYEPHVQYSDADAGVLVFVANHVGAAIERHQALEQVRNSEARYRCVVENVGIGVMVLQQERTVFVNPSTVDILGRSLEHLLTHSALDVLHPEDRPPMEARRAQRLRGETPAPNYGVRIITPAGEVRHLEVSSVPMEWGQAEATLLFLTDVTTRLQAEASQRQTLQQQVALNDLKTRFITMASHEFRTPLAAIHGSVELLQHYEDRMPAEKKRQTLQRIDDAVTRMTHMLENVLVIGRTDAGKLAFKPHALCINSLCHALVDEVCGAMPQERSRVQLLLDFPPPNLLHWLDDTLIRNIVGNLLSNALKYSPHGGDVVFQVREEDHALVFTVADHGIGIPPADQAQLFASFHRASNVGPIAGTGLGLSIVKEAVTCHQGTISVHSTLGQGSSFTVSLPTHRCTP